MHLEAVRGTGFQNYKGEVPTFIWDKPKEGSSRARETCGVGPARALNPFMFYTIIQACYKLQTPSPKKDPQLGPIAI